MNSAQFNGLKNPLEHHIAQVNTYCGLFGQGAAGQVWYENKDTQDLKTFCWPYDSTIFDAGIERVLHVADEILRGGLPTGCGKCGLDTYIGELQGVEERLATLAQVRETYG